MKGQAQIFAAGAVVVVVLAMTLIGLTIYGLVSNVYPHDQTITNETLCTTCTPGTTLYRFDNIPILNDTDLICFNDSSDVMTNGGLTSENESLGYNIAGSTDINLTHTGDVSEYYTDVVCTYTFDEANSNEQSFFDSNTSVTFSGFGLLSIAGIILAAVAILTIILFLRG